MGTLNFEDKDGRTFLRKIRPVLKKRGLEPDLEADWEVHGPHSGMNYQVLVGYCKDGTCVAIYPRVVYEIDDPDEWYRPDPEKRLFCSL